MDADDAAPPLPPLPSSSTSTPTPNLTNAPRIQFLQRRFHQLILILIVGYGVLCLVLCALLAYQRRHRRRALLGDAASTTKIILPALESLLIVLTITTVLYTLFFTTALATNMHTEGISTVATEVFYSGRQFVFLSVVMFMLQSNVSHAALRRALVLALVLSTYTIPIVWLMVALRTAKDHFHVIRTAARAAILLLYGYAFFQPHGRASKRALSEFCLYATVYFVLLFVYNHLFYKDQLVPGFLLTYANLVWGSLCPFVIWRVLKADTDHWRTLGHRAVSLQRSNHLRATSPTTRFAASGHSLRVELKRRRVVDFAHLDCQRLFDETRECSVYHTVLRGATDVIAKIYRPPELNEDAVAQFAEEAALWDALRHPNVLKLVGICVYPPTIQLLFEFTHGSLGDASQAKALRAVASRQQQLINIGYLLDMTRAVAFLHSFAPPFILGEVRPDSFLMDTQGNVKLGHLGLARSIDGHCVTTRPMSSPAPKRTSHHDLEVTLSCSASTPLNCMAEGAASQHPSREWIEFVAPEVLQDQPSLADEGTASDVYALAITMYAVLYPVRVIYPATPHDALQEAIVHGLRPSLSDGPATHPILSTLLENMWHADPRLRPSASHIVNILELIQEELCGEFAERLVCDLRQHEYLRLAEPQLRVMREVASGEQITHVLRLHQYVESEGEALRLGNALMDAGVLHHVTHSHAFRNDETEMYYFSDLGDDQDTDSQRDDKLMLASNNSSLMTASSSASSMAFSALLASSRRRGTTDWQSVSRSQRRRPRVPSDATELLSGTGNCACRPLSQRLNVSTKPKVMKPFRQESPAPPAEDWSQIALMIVPNQCGGAL